MYDLFISYKSSDRAIAQELLNRLMNIDPDLSIFWSEKSLHEIGNSDYTEAIENAIRNSKNMVVIGTTIDTFFSKWVSYEWRMFKHLQLNDKKSIYKNLLVACSDINCSELPIALQMCECVELNEYERVYNYLSKTQGNMSSSKTLVGLDTIQNLFDEISWNNSILLSAAALSDYEASICSELSQVTILSHTLNEDSPGGALFDTVSKNMSNGVKYNYIFLDSRKAYGVLRNIRKGHVGVGEDVLLLEVAEDSFWALGTYANVTIYEFINGRVSEGYIRIMVQTNHGEKPVYLKMSEAFINTLWNNIEDYRANQLIKIYRG